MKTTKRSFVMVRIPAGEFIMGSPPGHGHQDEFPPHVVFLDEYLIGRGPATAAEYSLFLNEAGNPNWDYLEPSEHSTIIYRDKMYRPRQGLSDYPANGATWFGARAFCQWLSEKTGKRFDLPSEAQDRKSVR